MKGVVFPGDRQVETLDFPDPSPGPDEVVMEIRASGMCGSDLHIYRAAAGDPSLGLPADGSPVIAGHEPCGVVVARGAGVPDGVAPLGSRVMCHHYRGCGICATCRSGWQQLCSEGIAVYGVTEHGAHAPYMKAPAATMVPLPEPLSFAEGAAISCGTGTAYAALERMRLTGRDTLAVFGQGPVGLSAVMFAAEMGARVIALDISRERLALARDFGASECVDSSDGEVVQRLHDMTRGEGVSMAIDCSGSSQACIQAVRSTRTWGIVCFVGEGGTLTLDVSQDMLRRQLTLIGSWTFSSPGQSECARYVADRGIDLERIFTHRYSLDQAEEAYRRFDRQTTGKGVFEF